MPGERRVPSSLRGALVSSRGALAHPASARTDRTLRRRWLEALGSFPVMALGVALLLRSDVGSSPFDALNTGIAESLGVPLFVAILIVASSAMVIGMALGGTVGPLTFALLIGLGVLVDAVYSIMPTVEPLLPRVLMFAIGLLLTVTGVALQVNAEVGPGPGEVLMLGFVKQGISVRAAKWGLDAAVLIIGVALGGMVGVGTAVMMVAFAPLLAQVLRMLGYVPPGAAAGGGAARAAAPLELAPPAVGAPSPVVEVVVSTGPVPVTPAIIPACD